MESHAESMDLRVPGVRRRSGTYTELKSTIPLLPLLASAPNIVLILFYASTRCLVGFFHRLLVEGCSFAPLSREGARQRNGWRGPYLPSVLWSLKTRP
jgi:hypothetical protein